MGQKVAPTYVSLVMAYLELKLHQETEKEYGTENKNYILKNWKRFLDDCFIPWNLKIASLDHFHNLLNSLHPRIKFTKEWSEKEINFLDVTVIKNTNGKVTTLSIMSTSNLDTHVTPKLIYHLILREELEL